MNNGEPLSLDGSEIAIIGMAGRFPGAKTIDEFWGNLCRGVESVTQLSDDEIEPSGVDPLVKTQPNFVRAAAVLEGADLFDAAFFGYSPREAEVMDPQHRVLLECASDAIENAGYDPERYKGSIGVFAGAASDTYLYNIISNRDLLSSIGSFEVGIGNDLAFLSTRVSYKLNLRGPSYSIHTACSTSLVAVHLACQSLLIDECQMALAGGVAIHIPQKAGYLFKQGGVASPDGHTRAFDARAQGTLFGNGVGLAVLKRLGDALADGDNIHAVIRGSAANNDGSFKASFSAPSVYGQTEVIAEALANAGVGPETIGYVEAHGTGTALGDPIEIRALTRAFSSSAGRKDPCSIGSVKTNIGHLDSAAGIASLLKTILVVKHGFIPASLNFEQVNPKIDFADSPFRVNSAASDWPHVGGPRRAGVSSFGIGGTNAHVILEEPPQVAESGPARKWQMLILSGRTEGSLEKATDNLGEHLGRRTEQNLGDVAFTLQTGRREFAHRRMLVCRDAREAASALKDRASSQVVTEYQEINDRAVMFMFPGGGSQYLNMGVDLYREEPFYREQIDLCREILRPKLDLGLLKYLYADSTTDEKSLTLSKPTVGLCALFATEYAMARLLMNWGITPGAMIGHSLGEYVAACLSEVLSLEDALALVAERGRLFESLPKGAMLSVSLSEKEVRSLSNGDLSIAAINGPSQCVVSGPIDLIEGMAAVLTSEKIEHRRLRIEAAGHSMLVDPILKQFAAFVDGIPLRPPKIPFISNVTGKWIAQDEAMSSRYWANHLRETVRFSDGVTEMTRDSAAVLLEVGPGQSLSTLVKMQKENAAGRIILNSMRHPLETRSDVAHILGTVGRMWLSGVRIDWEAFYCDQRRRRVELPTYPFERQRYWLEARTQWAGESKHTMLGKEPDIADWFHVPSWKRTALPALSGAAAEPQSFWLIFVDREGLGSALIERLDKLGIPFLTVSPGAGFAEQGENCYALDPKSPADYQKLIAELHGSARLPTNIVHLWSITAGDVESSADLFRGMQYSGAYSILFLAQALLDYNVSQPVQLWVVSNHLVEVSSSDIVCPEKATLFGVCKVVPQEIDTVACRSIDIDFPDPNSEELADRLIKELHACPTDVMIAYRGSHRWVQTYEPLRIQRDSQEIRPLKEGGVYLITGGLGGVGHMVARYVAQRCKARLVLTGRTALPPRADWGNWLSAHPDGDTVAGKIRKVLELESLGAEVLIANADVANVEQMESAVTETLERFGDLNGVIHTAGVTTGSSIFRFIKEMSPADFELQYQPKAYGLYVLEKVLRGKSLDFCLLFSSNASVLGGLGFAAYSAANNFVDAFASHRDRKAAFRWISASWDSWPEETRKIKNVQTSMDQYIMTSDESLEAFRRVALIADASQIVVATGDLLNRIDLWVRRMFIATGDGSAAREPSAVYPRPQVQSAYMAPRNETEEIIAGIWQRGLGIEKVGVRDSFFELGGHSLLATRVIAQVRDALGVDLPLRTIFESPSVEGLARAISERQDEQVRAEQEQILSLINNLSEEQAEAEIAKMSAGTGSGRDQD